MAKTYYSVLTTYGAQLFAQAMANRQQVRITQFAVGDGNGRAVQPDSTRTALVRQVHRANISAVSPDPRNNKQVIFELTIPETVGGFWIREMGIFDANNKLVAYANCPDTYKPRLDEGSGKVQVMRMILLVSSSNAVTLTVDDTVIFATRGQLTPKTITATSQNGVDDTGHSHEIDQASTIGAGIVQLSNSTSSEDETKAATPKAIKAAYDKAVAAENLARGKQSPATTLAGYGITDGVVVEMLIGIPLPYPLAAVPDRFLAMNGQRFDKTRYPKLAQRYPSGVLPDLRGEFIRGWDNGRNVDVGRRILTSQKGSVTAIDVANHLDNSSIHGLAIKANTSATYLDAAAIAGFDTTMSNDMNNFYQLWALKSRVNGIDGSEAALAYSYRRTEPDNSHINGYTRPRNIAFQYICLAG